MNRFLLSLFILLAAGMCNKEPDVPSPAKINYKLEPTTVTVYPKNANRPVQINGVFQDMEQIPSVSVSAPSALSIKTEVDGNKFTTTLTTVGSLSGKYSVDFTFTAGKTTEKAKVTAEAARASIVKQPGASYLWFDAKGANMDIDIDTNVPAELLDAWVESDGERAPLQAIVSSESGKLRVMARSFNPANDYHAFINLVDIETQDVYDRIEVWQSQDEPTKGQYPQIIFDGLREGVHDILFPDQDLVFPFHISSKYAVEDIEIRCINPNIVAEIDDDYYTKAIYTHLLKVHATGDFNDVEYLTIRAKNKNGWGEEARYEIKKASLKLEKDDISVSADRNVLTLKVEKNFESELDIECNKHFMRGEFDKNGDLVLTVISNIGEERWGDLHVISPCGLSCSVHVTQAAWKEPQTGLTDKELRARDSVAVRKLLLAIHAETGHEPEIYERMFDPSYDMTYWPGNIEVSRATNRVTVIRAAGVGDGKTPGYIPDEIGDLTELKQLEITQPLNKPVPESMKKCVKLTKLALNWVQLDGSLNCEPWQSLASHLQYLGLEGNNFTGSFPDWVADMPIVEGNPLYPMYWLNGNRLSGKVPECVSSTPHWNAITLDGSGETFGQQNMKQQEGYVLYE